MEKRKKCGGLFGRCRSSREFWRWMGKTVKRGVEEVVGKGREGNGRVGLGREGKGREGMGWEGMGRCRERLARPGGSLISRFLPQ